MAAYKQTYTNYSKEDENKNELSNLFLWSRWVHGSRCSTLTHLEVEWKQQTIQTKEVDWATGVYISYLPTVHNTNRNIP